MTNVKIIINNCCRKLLAFLSKCLMIGLVDSKTGGKVKIIGQVHLCFHGLHIPHWIHSHGTVLGKWTLHPPKLRSQSSIQRIALFPIPIPYSCFPFPYLCPPVPYSWLLSRSLSPRSHSKYSRLIYSLCIKAKFSWWAW